MPEKVLLFLDGGFVKKKLQGQTKAFPTVREVIALCTMIMGKPRLQGKELLRVYYYDAPPLDGNTTNPLDGSTVNFSSTPRPPRIGLSSTRLNWSRTLPSAAAHSLKTAGNWGRALSET